MDLELAPKVFAAVHAAITRGLVRACHDPSEGGLSVALAEMAFAGGVGADVTDLKAAAADLSDTARLFGESPTRFLLEVPAAKLNDVQVLCGADVPAIVLGKTVKEKRLWIAGRIGEWLLWSPLDKLKEAWQKPLRW